MINSQIREKNDLAILVKGEKVLEKQGIVTFDAFYKSKKDLNTNNTNKTNYTNNY